MDFTKVKKVLPMAADLFLVMTQEIVKRVKDSADTRAKLESGNTVTSAEPKKTVTRRTE